jgi:hypothetical protein
MADTIYHEFSAEAVNQAIEAAKMHNETFGLAAPNDQMSLAGGGEFSISAQCISISVQNHRICLRLPLGIGNICLPVPGFVPNGTAAQACLSICTTWGIPTGLKVTISALGHVILTKSFGRC